MPKTQLGPNIDHIEIVAYRIPTETLESDGTLEWHSTTMVLVEIKADGHSGIGYTYADKAAAQIVHSTLSDLIEGKPAFDVHQHWLTMTQAIRNLGPHGLASMAVAAVDIALWDLKAHLLKLPLVQLLGQVHGQLPGYGSGGFTSYSITELEQHMSRWVELGYQRVKMKVGRKPEQDTTRVHAARHAIGPDVELYVDANGAYDRKQALNFAKIFHENMDVTWFEEPVSSEDLEGLRLLRDRAPLGLEIAAGEYGYSAATFRNLLIHGSVDVLQADATRCCGITGFLDVAALCWAFHIPLSSHCAPALHLHPCLAAPQARHMECFYDHLRIEELFFAGLSKPVNGMFAADLSQPGIGWELKRKDIVKYRV